MTIPTIKKVGYTKVFEATRQSTAQVLVHVGGAGSSKSFSIAQYVTECNVIYSHLNIAVCRKTFPALRMTAMGLILDMLKEYGLYQESNHNKTSNTYRLNENTNWFFSLDESEKIRSTSFNLIWVEEASEISWEDFVTLKLRLRAPAPVGFRNKIILSLNPSDSFGYVATKLCGVSSGT